ncbi:MAG TPA: FAD-dependent oxidoreductase [Candidatus Binatia bacterium]|nr:FAD-dependent oxidoreductase [Candidatus Binatia bacterium]
MPTSTSQPEAPNAAGNDLPAQARVVVIGGGIVGTSVLFHLTERGWKDVVLLERRRLTSGTTWHAAGLVGQLRATYNMSLLASYAKELFAELERRTGSGTGFIQPGSLLVATTPGRWEEIRRGASMAHLIGVDLELLDRDQVAARWPLLDASEVIGAAYLPGDGVASPTEVTHALAQAARMAGAAVHEQTPVLEVLREGGRVTGVRTERGTIACEYVVNCTGMWAREFGATAGVGIPLHAAEHFYLVTEPIEGLGPELPVLRMPDDALYARNELGKLMVGFFEPNAKPWATEGVPVDSEFLSLPADWDHLEPWIERAAKRIPVFGQVGIQLFFNGPESFTPDDRYVLGEAPGVRGYFVAAGFNSVGFASGGGAGRAVADWIVDGHAPMDLWEVDIRRFMPFQRNRRYLYERTTETLGLLYEMHWPFRQMTTSRGIRRSPLHDRLAALGACFGEVAGWERANWYAPPGVEPRYEYSYGRQNWFPYAAEEHRAVRENVGLFDLTSFGKILVQGRDAARELNRVCAADIAVEPGRLVYTQWLNERGGIESDVTVSRLDETRFMVITTGASAIRDLDHLARTIDPDAHVTVTDVTSAEAVISVMGPRSRELLSSVSDSDLSNAAFPFGTVREIDLGMAFVRAARVTYVGELGWELYVPTEFAVHVHETLVRAGEALGLRHAGYHALDSLRIEKAYRHWGHDITDEDSPLQAGLGFTVAWDKPGGFIGREALLRQRDAGVRRRLVVVVLGQEEPLLYHNEPILRNGRIVGRLTSAAFGHTIVRPIGLGYVTRDDGPVTAEWLAAGTYEIEVALERYPAAASLRAPYDPANERIHA